MRDAAARAMHVWNSPRIVDDEVCNPDPIVLYLFYWCVDLFILNQFVIEAEVLWNKIMGSIVDCVCML